MNFYKASPIDLEFVKSITHTTIKEIYPRYYPDGVVDFFINHHSEEDILNDIENNEVYIFELNGEKIATGTISDINYIGRVFVLPEYQGKGYGHEVMNILENTISDHTSTVLLHSSLPAHGFYLKRGYITQKYYQRKTSKNCVLCFYVLEKSLLHNKTKIDYNNKTFKAVSNSTNGEASEETIFHYHQSGSMLWAEYMGGEILKGFLLGKVHPNCNLDFTYQHINKKNEIKIGKCISKPEIMKDGKIKLNEKWQWLDGDCSFGESIIIECKDSEL